MLAVNESLHYRRNVVCEVRDTATRKNAVLTHALCSNPLPIYIVLSHAEYWIGDLDGRSPVGGAAHSAQA